MAFRQDGTVTTVCGQKKIGLRYLHDLAKLLPNAHVKEFPDGYSSRITHQDDSWVRVEEIVRIQDQWIDLIKKSMTRWIAGLRDGMGLRFVQSQKASPPQYSNNSGSDVATEELRERMP